MKKQIVKIKAGVMIKRILTPKEKEEAKKKLFEVLNKIYEKHQKIRH